MKLGSDGVEVYNYDMDGKIRDICQFEDGQVVLLIENQEKDKMKLVELNTATGTYDESKSIYVDYDTFQYICAGKKGVQILNEKGIYEYDLKDASKTELMSFRGTFYELNQSADGVAEPSDFRFLDVDRVDVMRYSTVEKLSRVNVAEARTVLFVRAFMAYDTIKNAMVEFNKENEVYYVALEECEEGIDVEDFKQQTNVQLGTGKGADIIFGSAIEDVEALMEKGGLEDLRPWMEASEIKEDDFFPITFSCWRDAERIYGTLMYVQPKEAWVRKELIGEEKIIDINFLIESLLQYQEPAVLVETWDAKATVEFLLCGSENIWGMIDWENSTCDFSGEFFAKILQVAKQYKDDGKNLKDALVGPRKNAGVYRFVSEEELAAEGKVAVGYIFDDGGHVTVNETEVMGINSNSPYKEGAWEFLSYLLSAEGQKLLTWKDSNYPLRRQSYDDLIQREIEVGSIESVPKEDGHSITYFKGSGDVTLYKEQGVEAYRAINDLKIETAEAIKDTLEEARALPTKTRPILDIIYEEAAAYFTDTKTLEEIIPIIENRVQLYLNEKK